MPTNSEEPPVPAQNGAPVHATHRLRFRLRTLLFAPLVVAILLAVIFPKLMTGDFVQLTVVSIKNYDSRIVIELESVSSSDTSWGIPMSHIPFSSISVGSEPRPHWTDFMGTWPKRELITINLALKRTKMPGNVDDPMELINVKRGETYRVTPSNSLIIAKTRSAARQQRECVIEVDYGNRFGWGRP
jgi:hypothetical protein